ncbi:MAG: type 2 isopentenyl-diphosphate Delta-isomerase [Ignavibacteriaceae bacterium]
MTENPGLTSQRKKEHIELCLTDEVSFKEKTTGFERYDFVHYAITEVDISKIDFHTTFFNKKINYPFFISCMTGGTSKAEDINAQLSVAAEQLNIPLGVGSQRQALENTDYHKSYKIIRRNAPKIPILGNIGASQISAFKNFDQVKYLVDLVEANVMVVHVNPLQELLQKHGEPDFKGFIKKIEKLVKFLNIPVAVKEVGAGISKRAAERLLEAGVKGIDVAGAGGTSWAGVEILRNKGNNSNQFWDWGLPTSFCIKEIFKLKKKYKFVLIGSGGIYNAFDIAKALSLGADFAASARVILQTLYNNGVEGVVSLVEGWFDTIKKIMYLTSSGSLTDLRKNKLLKKEELY